MQLEQIITAAITVFLDSNEMRSLDSTPDLIHLDTAILEAICAKAEALESLTTSLAQIATDMACKGLTPQVVFDNMVPNFQQNTTTEIKTCVQSAYGQTPRECDIGPAYFAVLIRNKKGNVIASSLSDFHNYPDNEFTTRMEAVHKEWQRQTVGTNLFRLTEAAVRFLVMADPFVRCNLGKMARFTAIRSRVDKTPEWHREFMEKMGFEEGEHAKHDVEFCKDIAISM
jgi:hypothetical protein